MIDEAFKALVGGEPAAGPELDMANWPGWKVTMRGKTTLVYDPSIQDAEAAVRRVVGAKSVRQEGPKYFVVNGLSVWVEAVTFRSATAPPALSDWDYTG